VRGAVTPGAGGVAVVVFSRACRVLLYFVTDMTGLGSGCIWGDRVSQLVARPLCERC
jgi:hypothetical protein